MKMLAHSYQSQQNSNVTQVSNQQSAQTQTQNPDPSSLQQQEQPANPSIQMRLRDAAPPVTPATRSSRKRKSPPTINNEESSPQSEKQHPTPPPPPSATLQHVLPPPHTLVHPPPHMQPHSIPHGYQYDYTPGGMTQPHPSQVQPSPGQMAQHEHSQSPPPGSAGRALSSSKRAEQNRKAQRAFRERRDQHVKALESRSQLLDAALASADEANRRWEECRTLVDQLRIENTALRAALNNVQVHQGGGGNHGAHGIEAGHADESNAFKNDAGSETSQSDTGSKKE